MAVFLALGLMLLIWFVRDILPLVVVSALIAFILYPAVTFLTRHIFRSPDGHGTRRGLAVLLTFSFAIFVLAIAFIVVIPATVEQLEEFAASIPRRLDGLITDVENLLRQPVYFSGEPILIDGEPFVPMDRIAEATGTDDLTNLLQFRVEDLQSAIATFFSSAGSLTGTAFNFLGTAFNTGINVMLLLVMTFYLMKDGDLFIDGLIDLAPDDYQNDMRRLLQELGTVWNAYVRGQLILCVVMGLVVYFAALLLGVPNAPILGLLAGLLEFIPNIGPLIALIPAAFLALVSQSSTLPFLEGPAFALVVIIVWTGLQNLESMLLVPRIMGESLNLHPFAVIVAVLGGAAVAGALGVILAAPLLASGRVITRYVYGKLTGRAPFREVEAGGSDPPLTVRLFGGLWERIQRLRGRKTQTTDRSQPAGD
jgi:predicted PurR-regulated permease PerM